MRSARLNDHDRRRLDGRGIPLDEARRQLELLARPERHAELLRPATVGDGIVEIGVEEGDALAATHALAAAAGRLSKFVPASGAATRMFRALEHFRHEERDVAWDAIRARAGSGDATAGALARFVEHLAELPFHPALSREIAARGERLEALASRGDFLPILDALLGSAGLGYVTAPKGLLPFHRYPDGERTAFEEHLVEAARYARDASGTCRLHFTVSPEHRAAFAERLAREGPRLEERWQARFEVAYSEQKPSTDTLALDAEGQPLRDESGALVLRPGGHGALIENLAETGGDVVFVKNIDNVQPDARKDATVRWKRVLAGLALRLQAHAHRHLSHLRREPPGEALDEAAAFVERELRSAPVPAGDRERRRAALVERLDRPLRVCGVVRNTGEPGGGPFWVRSSSGAPALQIVEAAEVDSSPGQRAILSAATHFNPVDLVCALRDETGRPYDLRRFVDDSAVLVTRKSIAGRAIRVLERPGLWNGGMAGWNTVFVEVPLETFSPVKTVLDLLRPEHRA